MKNDLSWALVSGFFLLGSLIALVIGAGGFLFLSGYHAGLLQHPKCDKPLLNK